MKAFLYMLGILAFAIQVVCLMGSILRIADWATEKARAFPPQTPQMTTGHRPETLEASGFQGPEP